MKTGDIYEVEFSFSQEEVVAFAKVSGDYNPIHLDAEYAAQTVFKKPIIHGFLGGSVISRVMGTEFPGEGTIYLSQTMTFRRPMFAGEKYKAVFTVMEVDERRHRARIETNIVSLEDQKPTLTGEAFVMNSLKI
ncbi:MAG: MaoC family dehydratase [Bacteroidia bacterium]|nr:MaoC family dehydratase [Bacteroidia bacterium]